MKPARTKSLADAGDKASNPEKGGAKAPPAGSTEASSKAGDASDLARKVKELETERELFFLQIDSIKKQHADEIKEIEHQLADANGKRVAMNERLDRVKLVEKAIGALYGEFVPENISRRTGGATAEENPLVALDMLRAYIRSLLTFKEDYENELKSRIEKNRSHTEEELLQLRRLLDDQETELKNARHVAEKAVAARLEMERDKKKTEERVDLLISEMKSDNVKLIDMVKKKEGDIDELHQALSKRDEILRHKEMKMMRITQLESEISKTKARHQFDLNQLRAQNVKNIQVFDKEMSQSNKLLAENKALEEKLAKAEIQLIAYRNDASRTKCVEMEQRLQKAEAHLAGTSAENRKLQDENSKLRHRVDELERKLVGMKHEYDKVFVSAEKERQIRRVEEERQIRESVSKSIADKEVVSADYYKRKLKEREREIAELTKRVRKLLLAEKNTMLATAEVVPELDSSARVHYTDTAPHREDVNFSLDLSGSS